MPSSATVGSMPSSGWARCASAWCGAPVRASRLPGRSSTGRGRAAARAGRPPCAVARHDAFERAMHQAHQAAHRRAGPRTDHRGGGADAGSGGTGLPEGGQPLGEPDPRPDGRAARQADRPGPDERRTRTWRWPAPMAFQVVFLCEPTKEPASGGRQPVAGIEPVIASWPARQVAHMRVRELATVRGQGPHGAGILI